MVNCTLYKALEVDWGGSATRRGGDKGGFQKGLKPLHLNSDVTNN